MFYIGGGSRGQGGGGGMFAPTKIVLWGQCPHKNLQQLLMAMLALVCAQRGNAGL